jgi:hypothetical protein
LSNSRSLLLAVLGLWMSACLSPGVTVCEGGFVCGPDEACRNGVCVIATCGNGRRDTGEICDGDELGGNSCFSEGYWDGSLSCTADCELDTTGCTQTCSDGVVNGPEQCDGVGPSDDCYALGLDFGEIGCSDCAWELGQCSFLDWGTESFGGNWLVRAVVVTPDGALFAGAASEALWTRRDGVWSRSEDVAEVWALTPGQGNQVWAATETGTYFFDGNIWNHAGLSDSVRDILAFAEDDVVAMTLTGPLDAPTTGLWHFDGSAWSSHGTLVGQGIALAGEHGGNYFVAIKDSNVYAIHNFDGSVIAPGPAWPGEDIGDIASDGKGGLLVAGSSRPNSDSYHYDNGQWLSLGSDFSRVASHGESAVFVGAVAAIALYQHGSMVYLQQAAQSLRQSVFIAPGSIVVGARVSTVFEANRTVLGTIPVPASMLSVTASGPGEFIGIDGGGNWHRWRQGNWQVGGNKPLDQTPMVTLNDGTVLSLGFDDRFRTLAPGSSTWALHSIAPPSTGYSAQIRGSSADDIYLASNGGQGPELFHYGGSSGWGSNVAPDTQGTALSELVVTGVGTGYYFISDQVYAVDGDILTLHSQLDSLVSAAWADEQGTVVVGTTGSGVYFLEDNQWVERSPSLAAALVEISGSGSGNIVAMDQGGSIHLYAGSRWSRIRRPSNVAFSRIAVYEDRIMLIGASGIYAILLL